MQLQFEDGIDLREAKTNNFGGQTVFFVAEFYPGNTFGFSALRNRDGFVRKEIEEVFAGVCAAGRTTDDPDHFVQVIERDLVTEQDMLALFRFAQFVLRAAANHIYAMRNE